MQRQKPMQNGPFWSKIKNAENMRKTILQEFCSCSVQKTALKNNKYSRNKIIFKIAILQRLLPMERH